MLVIFEDLTLLLSILCSWGLPLKLGFFLGLIPVYSLGLLAGAEKGLSPSFSPPGALVWERGFWRRDMLPEHECTLQEHRASFAPLSPRRFHGRAY